GIDPIEIARKLRKETRVDEGLIQPQGTPQVAAADQTAGAPCWPMITRPHFRLNVFQKCRSHVPWGEPRDVTGLFVGGANVRCVCVCPHRAVHSRSGCLYSMHFGQSFRPYSHCTFVMPRFFRTRTTD